MKDALLIGRIALRAGDELLVDLRHAEVDRRLCLEPIPPEHLEVLAERVVDEDRRAVVEGRVLLEDSAEAVVPGQVGEEAIVGRHTPHGVRRADRADCRDRTALRENVVVREHNTFERATGARRVHHQARGVGIPAFGTLEEELARPFARGAGEGSQHVVERHHWNRTALTLPEPRTRERDDDARRRRQPDAREPSGIG